MRALPGVKNYKCMNIKVGDFWKRNVFGLNRYDKSLQKSWHTTRLFENSNFAVKMPPLGRSICDLWLETKNGMAWLWLGEMGRKTGNGTGEGWGEGAREEGRVGQGRGKATDTPTQRCLPACVSVRMGERNYAPHEMRDEWDKCISVAFLCSPSFNEKKQKIVWLSGLEIRIGVVIEVRN